MSKVIGSKEEIHLRQEIISQCTWSETYSSLKHILKRTANQLPLLISFINNNSDQQATNNNYRTILFFHRTFSNKLLLTPLQRRKDQPDQFEIYPHHCTFVMPDFFRGLFEFVLCGQRCSRIYKNLEQLITFASDFKHSIVFISRDRVVAFFQDSNFLDWSSKKYPQGAIFRVERIHRSSVSSRNGRQIPNDYLECLDEDGYYVFIKMDQSGRYSIIATSIEQQENQPEIYLHSTQTSNIDQLIKRVTLYYDNKSNSNNIRLVRGSVPHNFLCQHFHFIRQHTYEMLVGLTQEDLVIEWNLECHVPCRYATNLNDILDSIYGTILQQTLESYINQAQKHYRNNFQYNIQLASSQNWTAFFQYWRWTRKNRQKSKDDNKVKYQSRHQFHLVASIQDLSDSSQGLSSTFKNNLNLSLSSSSLKENSSTQNKKTLLPKQRSFFSQMSKLILSSASSRHHHSDRLSRQTRRTSGFMLPNTTKPFDDSIYESNQVHPSS